MRNLEYACLGFPNNWYKVDESLMVSKYFKPMLVRDADTKEILIDNRKKGDADSLSPYEVFIETNEKKSELIDIIQDFIKEEESRLWERKRHWLKVKGDISFHNLQSIQGQLGLIDRLKSKINE